MLYEIDLELREKNPEVARRAVLADVRDESRIRRLFEEIRPELVFHIGSKVGGIHANATLPADFLRENLLIETNVIDGAHRFGVRKLLFVASNCTYPSQAPNPIREDALFTGPLDPNIRAYAVGKIAGMELCRAYRRQYGRDFFSVIPPNLYGPGDNYHPQNSHVIPALLRRFHEARTNATPEVAIWGTGTPRREFLFVDDMAEACVFVMDLPPEVHAAQVQPQNSHLNVGYGEDVTIAELARLVARVVGYPGRIVFDTRMPDGAPRKLMDSARLNALGWKPRIALEAGLRRAYQDFLARQP